MKIEYNIMYDYERYLMLKHRPACATFALILHKQSPKCVLEWLHTICINIHVNRILLIRILKIIHFRYCHRCCHFGFRWILNGKEKGFPYAFIGKSCKRLLLHFCCY